jgi:uncharacterized protein YcfL
MHVCVKTFSIRYEVYWYDKNQLDFLKQERKLKKDQSKVKPYLGLATLI